MAYPPAYTRTFSFTDWETLHPDEPKPGDKLDTEYDGVSNALTATQTNLALIQRADGALANDSVGEDQLQDGIFDGIADGITADAEAAATAAAASAAAAAGSAASAGADAALALTSRNESAGFAAQAGVSQGIAQSAGSDAAAMADDAADSAAAAANSANEAQGFRNEAEGFEELAFDWAEQLEGPVMPAPPGWPEAVDDGMFSSKWWAIRARDYNSTTTIDLGDGTGQADIGEGFDDWDAIPGNDLGVGQTYATWGTPTHTYVLIDRSNPSDPASWQDITGGPGPPGPPNTLTIGTVTTGAPGSAALADITGTAPNQVLSLTIPAGATGGVGPAGPAGPPNALSIGTVTTVPDGTPSSATITGTAPTQVLNLTLTAGPQGIQGIQGIQGPPGDISTGLAADSHVTGDWVFDPTQFFGFTPADVALIKASGFYTAADAIHTNIRTRLARLNGTHQLQFQRVNGAWNAATGILNNEQLGQIYFGGSTPAGALTTPLRVFGVAAGDWSASAQGAQLQIEATPAGSTTRVGVVSFRGESIDISVPINGTAGNWTGNHIWGNQAGGRYTLIGGASGEIRSRYDDNGVNIVLTTMNGGITAINQGWGWRNMFCRDGITFQDGGRILWMTEGDYSSAATQNSSLRVYLAINGADTEMISVRSSVMAISPPVQMYGGTLGVTGPANAQISAQVSAGNAAILAALVTSTEGLYIVDNYSAAAVAGIPPNATGMGNVVGSPMVFTIASTERMRITAGGVSTPNGFYAGDGSAASASFSFNGDTDTGMWHSAANEISFTAGGGSAVAIQTTGLTMYNGKVIANSDGTAAAPSYTFGGDPDTGIFRLGSNNMAFSVGGVAEAYILSGASQWQTQMRGADGSAAAPQFSFTNDVDTGFYRNSADAIGVAIAGSRKAVFFPGGFQVDSGAIFAPDGSAATPAHTFATDADTGLYLIGSNDVGLAAGGAGFLAVSGARGAYRPSLGNYPFFIDPAFVSGAIRVVTVAPSSGGALGDQWLVV